MLRQVGFVAKSDPKAGKKTAPIIGAAFSVIVFSVGLLLTTLISFGIADGKLTITWRGLFEAIVGSVFLAMPICLLWAAKRFVEFRNKQRFGRVLAVFGVLVTIVGLLLWLSLLAADFVYKYV